MIKIQENNFDIEAENLQLRCCEASPERSKEIGAVVTFTGIVREFTTLNNDKNNEKSSKHDFYLEHYPGMTEKVLKNIENEAHRRWDIITSTVIHRVGKLKASDNIVFIGVSCRHRKEAFEACEFIIDLLKTQAPFWKKEGDSWVNADNKDQEKTLQWLTSEKNAKNES